MPKQDTRARQKTKGKTQADLCLSGQEPAESTGSSKNELEAGDEAEGNLAQRPRGGSHIFYGSSGESASTEKLVELGSDQCFGDFHPSGYTPKLETAVAAQSSHVLILACRDLKRVFGSYSSRSQLIIESLLKFVQSKSQIYQLIFSTYFFSNEVYDYNQVIFNEKDAQNQCVYIVYGGFVQIIKSSQLNANVNHHLVQLKRGDIFGHEDTCYNRSRSYRALSVSSDTVLLTIRLQDLQKVFCAVSGKSVLSQITNHGIKILNWMQMKTEQFDQQLDLVNFSKPSKGLNNIYNYELFVKELMKVSPAAQRIQDAQARKKPGKFSPDASIPSPLSMKNMVKHLALNHQKNSLINNQNL